jgi:signal transduction histidine kinase
VEDAVRTIRSQTEAKGQSLHLRVERNLPQIGVDRDRIRQVLVNLLTNAHEYCPEGAAITVTAERRDAELEIAVTDDGPGMAEDQVEHIFERFTRGDAGLTQHVGGTGLGLAISKSLVELHGGTIGASSRPGRGSTFRVSLPIAANAADGPKSGAVLRISAHRQEEIL